ncbi:tyrosine-type recombinase/integrase [Bacillus sp. FJAT-26390]|uniref:tyrosine-type recombinase/integrase n=1 Tax=Bacillus sp. FJAT-26390 TaxID=1743142 RepID=UPI000807CF48|nr:tyrosine-type recombinase/integrase [Bacillus sp. FJAT-26390]OBZ08066.1 hypothetical protein A7975_27470 [Bacillus sp. FJAT-26390]
MPIYPYTKSGKEHWYYAFEVKDRNGKRKTIKERGFTGKTAAREAERLARVEWDKGTYLDPSKLTVEDYLPQWLKDKQDISPETRETYESHLKVHINPAVGKVLVQKFGVKDIKSLIKFLQEYKQENGKNLSEGTIKKIYNIVQTAFGAAKIEGLINIDPFDSMDKGSVPKVNKVNHDYWTKDEVKQFFSKLDHRFKILFVIAVYTGMRRGEITGLRWSDVDLDNGILSIRQTLKPRGRIKDGGKSVNASRSITLSPFVISELKKHRAMIVQERWGAVERYRNLSELEHAQKNYKDLDLVICQTNGDPISIGNFTKFWNGVIKKTEMRYIKFHDLRHTCASLLLSNGTHPKVVQELLGHSSISITLDTYSHMLPNMQEEAVKSLDKLLN